MGPVVTGVTPHRRIGALRFCDRGGVRPSGGQADRQTGGDGAVWVVGQRAAAWRRVDV